MAVQTSYDVAQPIAFAGMQGDLNPTVIDSMISGEASAAIPFGKFVASYAGGADNAVRLPTTSTAKLLRGVLVHSHNYAKAFTVGGVTSGELDGTGLLPGAQLNVMVKGRVWVLSETAAAVGDPVFVRFDIGEAGESYGSVANAADESDMIDCTSKGRYVTSVSSASVAAPALALIEIDMVG